MPQPTRSQVHIDTLATNMSVAYKPTGFIGDQILPIVKVAKATGKYAKYTKAPWFRNEAAVRAPGTRAARTEWSMDTAGSYACIEYSLSGALPDDIRAIADDPIQPERSTIEKLTGQMLLNREMRVAALLFNTTTFASYYATAAGLSGGAGVQWDTYETSDPLQDVNVMVNNVISVTGVKPNIMVMGQDVYKALKVHPALVNRVTVSGKGLGVLTTDLMAQLFDMEKILVGSTLYTADEEGTSESYSYVWGKYVLVAYVTKAAALESPSLGYILSLKDREMKYYREDQEHQDVWECTMSEDEIVTSAPSGYLLSSVVS